MVTIAIPKEIFAGERRVAATPETITKIVHHGFSIAVEKGAGLLSSFSDEEYKAAGAEVKSEVLSDADVILSVNPPAKHHKHQLELVKNGAIWISLFVPQAEPELIELAAKRSVTLFSLNLLPRISRAQRMDALTSQSNISGYKAVLLAANVLGKIFPLMMTAAGTIQPARVVVLGAGVAGLQAIATAKRLGARVEASDIRREAKEQVESLGASFIDPPAEEGSMQDEKGYAKEVTKDFLKRQQEEVAKRIKQADVVITTALVPGRKAPILITKDVVKEMKRGAVIIDMAAAAGGNCEETAPGKTIDKDGVMIIGESNIPSLIAHNASQLYSRNILHFFEGMIKEKKIHLQLDDQIYKDTLVTHDGKIMFGEKK